MNNAAKSFDVLAREAWASYISNYFDGLTKLFSDKTKKI